MGVSLLGIGDIGLADLFARQGGHFAGDADHGEAVPSVGGHRDVKDGVAHVLVERHTDRRVIVEDKDPCVLVRDAQLLLRADHSRRLDAADAGRLEDGGLAGVAVDEAGADAGEGDLLPRRDVGRSTDYRHLLAATQVDGRQPQTVGVRVGVDAGNQPHGYALPVAADAVDGLDAEAGHGEPVGQLLGRKVDVYVFSQPAKGDSHRFTQNCLRKRRSLA